MFTIQRGFEVCKMEDMEKVVVRLASFASNTRGVSNVPGALLHASRTWER
jgi:hypothetical protein